MGLRIEVTVPASDDLVNIETYIKEAYATPVAAKRAVRQIMKSYKSLSFSPYAGFSIKGKYGIDTPARILVSGQYIIFYRVIESENLIKILRVFHGMQNYIKKLFPDYKYDIDEEDFKDE
jgi:plasmid stabilization system protein ParE